MKNKTVTITKPLLINSIMCTINPLDCNYILTLYYTNGDFEEYEVTKDFYDNFTKHFVGF